MEKLIKTIATVLGIGYIPIAQGTFASLAALGIYIIIHNNITLYVLVTSIFIIAGFPVSGRAEAMFNKKDSRKIVIDDFSGMLLALLFIPFRTPYIIIVFVLYRFFDIVKLYPINRLERLPAGWGIMLDDIAAGLYANIILQIIARTITC